MDHTQTDEYKHRSESQRKRFSNPLERQKIGQSNKGKVRSIEFRKHLSEMRKGTNNPHYGRRHTTSSKKVMSEHQQGEKHYNWKGGSSYLPYCRKFNQAFRENVRDFFKRQCVECGKHESENLSKQGKRIKLHVHHVMYEKKTCCKEGELVGERKFVVLCTKCHIKTNTNRDHWQLRYQELIALQYGNKCYYNSNEWPIERKTA